jgi:hypothetical protein
MQQSSTLTLKAFRNFLLPTYQQFVYDQLRLPHRLLARIMQRFELRAACGAVFG